jgi:hypothetical protein
MIYGDPVFVTVDDACGFVGGSVVHDDDLDLRILLIECAFDGIRQVISIVVAGDDDSNQHPLNPRQC